MISHSFSILSKLVVVGDEMAEASPERAAMLCEHADDYEGGIKRLAMPR